MGANFYYEVAAKICRDHAKELLVKSFQTNEHRMSERLKAHARVAVECARLIEVQAVSEKNEA